MVIQTRQLPLAHQLLDFRQDQPLELSLGLEMKTRNYRVKGLSVKQRSRGTDSLLGKRRQKVDYQQFRTSCDGSCAERPELARKGYLI